MDLRSPPARPRPRCSRAASASTARRPSRPDLVGPRHPPPARSRAAGSRVHDDRACPWRRRCPRPARAAAGTPHPPPTGQRSSSSGGPPSRRLLMLEPGNQGGLPGDPGQAGSRPRILTVVLKATRGDPQGQGPGARLCNGLSSHRVFRRHGQPAPILPCPPARPAAKTSHQPGPDPSHPAARSHRKFSPPARPSPRAEKALHSSGPRSRLFAYRRPMIAISLRQMSSPLLCKAAHSVVLSSCKAAEPGRPPTDNSKKSAASSPTRRSAPRAMRSGASGPPAPRRGRPASHIDQRQLTEMATLIPVCELVTIPAGHR